MMSDTKTNSAQPAGVLTIENEHHDDVTVAWSALDYWSTEHGRADEVIDKCEEKISKCKDQLADAMQGLKDAKADKVRLAGEVERARSILTTVSQANPELAADADVRRGITKGQKIKELEAELRELKGGK